MGIKIISHNIAHTYNLCGLLDIMRINDTDLVFIQETNHTTNELTNLVQRFGYSAFTSLDGDKPGVGFIYKTSIQVDEIHVWQPGRLLFVRIGNISFVNVYANSGNLYKHQRNIMFTETLFRNLSTKSLLPVLLGDFNCILSKLDTTDNFERKFCQALMDLVHTLDYTDGFRKLYPNSLEFTYIKTNCAPSRLDRVYLPCHLEDTLLSICHKQTLSDHRLVSFDLDLDLDSVPDRPIRHLSYWKLNISILKHRDFEPNFLKFWQFLLTKEDSYQSTEIWWDELVKPKFKEFCIRFSTVLSNGRKGLKAFLYEALNQAAIEEDHDEVKEIRAKLKQIVNEEAMGFIIRSKEKERDDEEMASVYHHNKECKNGTKSTLTKLKIDGNIVDDPIRIEEEVTTFFSSLFNGHHRSDVNSLTPIDTGQPFVPDFSLLPEFLNDLGSIDQATADGLDQPISLDEVKLALKSCAKNKSPGLDGLPYEFYIKVQDLVAPVMTKIFNNQLEAGVLIPSFRKGVTKLIPKVDHGTVPDITQVRPITLLPDDFKIMAKVFSNRLTPILDEVLTSSQLCSKTDSNILFGATDFISVIDYINERGLNGYIVSFDVFKAYDKANIQVIAKIMKSMGFSDKFIGWIECMHKDIQTVFILQDGLSAPVNITVSVRQGDPLAMALYIIFVEPLLVQMKIQVSGLFIGRTKQANEAWVDDVSHASSKIEDIEKISILFDKYERLSGTVLNKAKCKVLGLGGWEGKQDWPIPWLKSAKSLKIFGITFHPTLKDTIYNSWLDCEDKVNKCLLSWKAKPVHTLSQRAFVLKVFATSKLWYLAQILPIPKKTIEYLEKLVGDFVWRGHLQRISLPELYLDTKQGGLGLPNISAKADSLFLMHIIRILRVDCPTRDHLMYWTGISLRDRLPEIVPALRSENTTSYFNHAVNLIKDSSLSVEVRLENLHLFKSKYIYEDFTSTTLPPKVEDQFDFKWELVWQRLNLGSVSSDAKDILFMVIHDIYPNKYRLFRMSKHPSGCCPNCRGKVQNNKHLFTECTLTKSVWIFVKNKLVYNKVLKNLVVDDFELLMLASDIDEAKKDLLSFFISMYVLYIHTSLKNESRPNINDFRHFLLEKNSTALEFSV